MAIFGDNGTLLAKQNSRGSRMKTSTSSNQLRNDRFLTNFLKPFRPTVPQPVTFVPRNQSRNKYRRWLSYCISTDFKFNITERIVEVPFVFQNLRLPEHSRILEFGCSQSLVSLQLASLGHDVSAVDVEDYPFSHPNLHFHKIDFLQNSFADGYFDGAIAISAIEHAGLGFYGDRCNEDGDRAVVQEIYRVLRKGGQFLLTAPYGKKGASSWARVYDKPGLLELLGKFKILAFRLFDGRGREAWTVAEPDQVAEVDSISTCQAVVCVVATKP